jgi:hypothetical protein
MITNANEILYTPIDSDGVPNYDLNKLLEWVKNNHKNQNIINRPDSSRYENIDNIYPWDVVYPRHNGEWKLNFNLEFPELANFFSTAFKLQESNIRNVGLLPMKNNFVGTGFWHNDADYHGLRIYLENEEPGDFLLIKPTVEPYNIIQKFGGRGTIEPIIPNVPLQDVTYSPKLKNSRQVFYLNNKRAVHAVQVPVAGRLRIAVIVNAYSTDAVNIHLNNLVCTSAEKFSEYTIHW